MSGAKDFAMVPKRAAASRLGARALRILIAIAAYAANGEAFPGLDRLADDTGIERCKIPEAITQLEQAKLIRCLRSDGGKGRTNRYLILFDQQQETVAELGTILGDETVTEAATVGRQNSGRLGVKTVAGLAQNGGRFGVKQWSNRQPEYIEHTKEQTKEQSRPAPRVSTATRLPDNFAVPDEWFELGTEARAKHKLPQIGLALEAEKFCNYWCAKAGASAAKKDWPRTFVNWCLSAKPTNSNGAVYDERTPANRRFDAGREATLRAALAREGADGTGDAARDRS